MKLRTYGLLAAFAAGTLALASPLAASAADNEITIGYQTASIPRRCDRGRNV